MKDSKQFKFNDHVCIECLLGVPDERRTGRIVQIRAGVGAFGSDVYILRLRDGSLMSFENAMVRMADDKRFEQAFYISNGKRPPVIPPQEPHPSDSETAEYNIAGKFPEIGFYIERPKQPKSAKQSFSLIITHP